MLLLSAVATYCAYLGKGDLRNLICVGCYGIRWAQRGAPIQVAKTLARMLQQTAPVVMAQCTNSPIEIFYEPDKHGAVERAYFRRSVPTRLFS